MQSIEAQINRAKKTSVTDNRVQKAIRNSHITQKANNSNPKKTPKDSGYRNTRLSDLRRLMAKETAKIVEDDIRGTDIPTEYVIGFAFILIAIVGAYIFYQISSSRNSLPMASKNRLD